MITRTTFFSQAGLLFTEIGIDVRCASASEHYTLLSTVHLVAAYQDLLPALGRIKYELCGIFLRRASPQPWTLHTHSLSFCQVYDVTNVRTKHWVVVLLHSYGFCFIDVITGVCISFLQGVRGWLERDMPNLVVRLHFYSCIIYNL